MKRKTLQKAFMATLPVMAGYLVLGAGFGMILKSRGLGILWAFCMSAFIYAGSMQFVLIDLLTGGASLLTTALTTFAVNARHLMYGLSMLERYRGAGWKKPYLIFALTDETYSLVCNGAPDGVDEKSYYLFTSLFDQLYWVCGSVLGSLLGTALHFNTEGMDFALTALFLTVFTEQWLTEKNHVSALCGVGISVLCLLIFGAEQFLIPTILGIMTVLLFVRPQEEAKA